jgi:hypothetical protein
MYIIPATQEAELKSSWPTQHDLVSEKNWKLKRGRVFVYIRLSLEIKLAFI